MVYNARTMSYCRFFWGGSEVYVIHHTGGYLECYCYEPGCIQTSRQGMIWHLLWHRARGESQLSFNLRIGRSIYCQVRSKA